MNFNTRSVFVDLTQKFSLPMPVYPGDLKPTLVQTSELKRDGYVDHVITTGMHVGTHVDAPFHFFAEGKKISDIAPDKFFGRGVVVNALGRKIIDTDALQDLEIREGDVVLVCTGHSIDFEKDNYFVNSPRLTLSFTEELIRKKIHMIGLDFPSPDEPPFELHKLFLKREILILENLCNLEKMLSIDYFEVMAFPPKFPTDGSPTRCVARIIN